MNLKKKIGILTQPLLTNYGGLLQAYALQRVLKEMNHEVWIINRKYSKPNLKGQLRSLGKRILAKSILKSSNININSNLKEEKVIAQNTNYFKNKYIQPITPPIYNDKEMYEINNLDFTTFIVGSDQVWRPRYSPNITNYYLDFAKDNKDIKRVSYAASFGVDNWEYSQMDTDVCQGLIKKFDAISVREDSAIRLCEDHFKTTAIHVLDPTMLLSAEDYVQLIRNEKEVESAGDLMTYVLDKTIEKEQFINKTAEKLNLSCFTVMQKCQLSGMSNLEDSIFPPVTKWLRGFMDAKFVITDSFHGCAFAIIFNKPFVALGNRKRGLARFSSLLKIFALENRLLLDNFSFEEKLIAQRIDWDKVNTILEKEKGKSLSFLKNSIN